MRRTSAGPALVLFVLAVAPAAAQVPRPLAPNEPVPKGQQIEVKDGDTIVVRGEARVRVVHRSDATVRAIWNGAQHWVVLLADFVDPKTSAPDGIVDSTFSFLDVDGAWPLGERWEGSAVFDEYSMANTPGGSYGLRTDAAFIQLFSGSPASNNPWFADAGAIRLSYRGGGRSNAAFPGGPRLTFDQAEERAVSDATRNAQRGSGVTTTMESPGGTTLRSRVGMGVSAAPVRVGGNIPTPDKLVDARPVLPPQVAQAGIHGVVILEIIIGTDGTVTDAKVLRSIPPLDQAAIDTVKQWRYARTQLNGQPVPVIMTVTVAF